jgi:hypothetical protein
MTWEWVAPAAAAASAVGASFFTYLAGTQSRRQSERLARQTDERNVSERVYKERREAYLAALRIMSLMIYRQRYTRDDGTEELLHQLDNAWPVMERVRMTIEARAAVEAFGTSQTAPLIERWYEARRASDLERMEAVYLEAAALFRAELSAMGTWTESGTTSGIDMRHRLRDHDWKRMRLWSPVKPE